MEHGIAVDAVIAGVTTPGGIHPALVVALLAKEVVELQILDDVHWYILQGRLHVAQHKLLAVEQYLRHLLAVDRDLAVLIHLSAGYPLDQFLNGRSLRSAKGVWIIDQGVLFYNDLSYTGCDDGLL